MLFCQIKERSKVRTKRGHKRKIFFCFHLKTKARKEGKRVSETKHLLLFFLDQRQEKAKENITGSKKQRKN
jgi:hypothetical protein